MSGGPQRTCLKSPLAGPRGLSLSVAWGPRGDQTRGPAASLPARPHPSMPPARLQPGDVVLNEVRLLKDGGRSRCRE